MRIQRPKLFVANTTDLTWSIQRTHTFMVKSQPMRIAFAKMECALGDSTREMSNVHFVQKKLSKREKEKSRNLLSGTLVSLYTTPLWLI